MNPEPVARVPRKRGRPKLAKTIAREKEAAKLGIHPDSLRRREWNQNRHLLPRRAPWAPTVEELLARRVIDTWGLDVDPEWLESVKTLAELVAAMRRQVAGIHRDLSQLRDKNAAMRRRPLAKALELAALLQVQLTALEPTSLCPWCKGQPGVREKCAACEGRIYVGKVELQQAPRDILDRDNPVVFFSGKAYRLEIPTKQEELALPPVDESSLEKPVEFSDADAHALMGTGQLPADDLPSDDWL